MKISQIFNLGKSQAELDFVDIDISIDIPLFLDPFFLGKRKDKWSIEATLTIKSFFQNLIDLIISNNEQDAKLLFDYLHEPNATCLGMSVGNPQGRGIGVEDTTKIYNNLLNSKAIQTGLIQDIEDNILFVEQFGKDKLSDMTTNIITKHLIDYTINQCTLHGIALSNATSGYYWSRESNDWESEYTKMLIIEGRKILLVPKGIVSFCKAYTPERYYSHFVVEFLQNEHLRINSSLVQRKKNGTFYVTKKNVKEENPLSKSFLRKFTNEHPQVLEQLKKETEVDSLRNFDIIDVDITQIGKTLITKLNNIPYGNDSATDFHNTIKGILEVIFYPNLINPVKEQDIHQGRKRIDITFDNASTSGIFHRLSETMKIPCQYIFIECKNYSRDIANPELDQISGRFSVNRGKVGFVICRQIENFALFINRCRDTYNDGRGLIIPLVDKDIIELLENVNDFNSDFTESFLSKRIREIILG